MSKSLSLLCKVTAPSSQRPPGSASVEKTLKTPCSLPSLASGSPDAFLLLKETLVTSETSDQPQDLKSWLEDEAKKWSAEFCPRLITPGVLSTG
ncbi:hypothetical protein E5288_WYG017210 [Bos mutus]|uniref:Uncharacterized protein n=1 Tax=Bos mutus TaxID=72004 RepID=A0A6B0RK02_9CETA|nr:hypothetical protein [Bos mutus]